MNAINVLSLFEKIRGFVFDIDGVLTDANLLVTYEGEMLRSMNVKDGYALEVAVQKGYHVWVISGGKSTACKKRLENLGVRIVKIGVKDKKEVLIELVQKYQIKPENLLYMGDDLPDKEAMLICGLKACPQDAATDIINIADYVSSRKGGENCVRDVIEKVLKINKDWN